jgi:hypothetical protein
MRSSQRYKNDKAVILFTVFFIAERKINALSKPTLWQPERIAVLHGRDFNQGYGKAAETVGTLHP